MPKRFNCLILILVFLGGCLTTNASAQDVRVEAFVNTNTVSLGSSINLTLKVTGAQSVDNIDLPAIDGFDVQYVGPATQIAMINGQYSSTVSHNYSLFALKTGPFEIPAINVVINGQVYATEPIGVQVVDSSQSPQVSSSEPPAASSSALEDKIFVVLKISKKDVYLNEPVPVKILFFVTGLSIADLQYPQLEGSGYKKDDFKDPQQYEQIVHGLPHKIVEFNTTIYPTRTGEVTLGPAKLECSILVKNSSSAGSTLDNFFNDDFFSNFFDQYERRPTTLQSDSVVLNVQDLPQEGKPQDFSEGVGNFEFDVKVGPSEVKVGDPITLRMTVQGKGNLSAVQFPSLKDNNQFKFYEPIIKEDGGIKTFEQVLIPNSDSVQEIPAMAFNYFDVDAKQYRTITKGPFPIKVSQLPQEESLKIVGLDKPLVSQTPEVLGQDIVYIKDSPGQWRVKDQVFYQSPWYAGLSLLGFILWLALNIFYFQTRRLETDIVYAKRLKAPREARKGLKRARDLMVSGKTIEFYDEASRVLQQYLSHRLHIPLGNMTFLVVQELLNLKGSDQKIIEAMRNMFEEYEMVRFASAAIDQNRMAQSLRQLEEVIDYLEKHVK